MKTQGINICEAINFALAGHPIGVYDDSYDSIQFKDGNLTITLNPSLLQSKRSTRILTGADFIKLKDLRFTAGDNRSIEGYYV